MLRVSFRFLQEYRLCKKLTMLKTTLYIKRKSGGTHWVDDYNFQGNG
jgi:hypothetical protein